MHRLYLYLLRHASVIREDVFSVCSAIWTSGILGGYPKGYFGESHILYVGEHFCIAWVVFCSWLRGCQRSFPTSPTTDSPPPPPPQFLKIQHDESLPQTSRPTTKPGLPLPPILLYKSPERTPSKSLYPPMKNDNENNSLRVTCSRSCARIWAFSPRIRVERPLSARMRWEILVNLRRKALVSLISCFYCLSTLTVKRKPDNLAILADFRPILADL